VGQWFYQVVGGIRPVRGEKAYKKFIIQPQIPNGVTWARTSQETPYGEISVNWKLQDEKMKMNIRVPVGSTGILQYPEGTTEIKINSKTITITGNQLELESGKHTVEYLL
jgi:alpha-L-rhamnosidase